jgi:hypothetical protein
VITSAASFPRAPAERVSGNEQPLRVMVIQRSMVRRFIDGEDRVQQTPLPNSLEDFLLLTITERRVLRL